MVMMVGKKSKLLCFSFGFIFFFVSHHRKETSDFILSIHGYLNLVCTLSFCL